MILSWLFRKKPKPNPQIEQLQRYIDRSLTRQEMWRLLKAKSGDTIKIGEWNVFVVSP